jgi:hypothetical protein
MSLVRAIAVLPAALAVVFMTVPADASTLSVVGASAKVCQLTGQTDWLTGQTTDAQTQSKYGLQGIDLGFPVESDTGDLYFLFGDAVPNGHPPGSFPTVPPDDALGKTARTAVPDSTTCIDMTLFSSGRRKSLGHPTVTPPIQQGSFNVPTGGVTVGSKFFAFFWTDHCVIPDNFGPNAATPLERPAAGAFCPETDASNSIGNSVLAYAVDSNPLAFTQVAPPLDIAYVPQMPNGFVYVTAALPGPRKRGVDYRPGYEAPIPVFGVARYRMSIPYLALAPQASFGAVSTWKFYGGTSPSGPIWLTYQQWQSGHVGSQWAPPADVELYANSPNVWSLSGDERCVGEHSVTWNAPLQVWLMLYTCGGWQVEARTAPDPWGPWSAPTILLSAVENPGLFCTLFWGKPGTSCPGLKSQQIPALTFGYLYAPFVISRYTQNVIPPGPGQAKQATIYWLLSTWDPYQATVMQSTLKLAP